jgi:predicted membrane-bound mannosyltransferase
MSLRLILAGAGALGVCAALGLFFHTLGEAKDLRAEVAGFHACELAVRDGPGAKPAAEVCSPEIALADQVARQAGACNAALAASNLYGIKASCSEPVKALDARAAAHAASLASARAELTTATRDRDTAVARAEARATTQTERATRAKAVVETAPRDGAGLRVYGADSLRQRWGQARP